MSARATLASTAAVWVLACAHPSPRPAERDLDIAAPPAAGSGSDAAAPDLLAAPSVVATANVPVRAQPTAGSARIGILGRDAHVKAVDARPATEGCDKRWIAIAPRGWVCETNLVASTDPPTAAAPVALDDTTSPELGSYGSVRDGWMYDSRDDAEADTGHPVDGGMIIRKVGTAVVHGARFVVASDGSLVDSQAVGGLTPSSFHGTAVVDGALDVAWTYRRATVHATPDGAYVATLPMHAQVAIGETSRGFVRIADGRWVARNDLRIPAFAAPPAGTGARDHWFDVDLHEQVLVAYEGVRPVYATLVSTGRPDHATAVADTHISLKLRMTTMTNSGADESYSVADVPWVMYYADKLALHGAYWHDRFGELHSHGCVNLAPRDARILFDWSAPDVPPGWTGVYASPDVPGSIVRIH